MSDLVQRLRSVDVSWSETGEWCAEAADRIEALQADLAAAEREAIVAWLRSEAAYDLASQSEHGDLLALADAIENGEHLK